jgi:hypothetical protein
MKFSKECALRGKPSHLAPGKEWCITVAPALRDVHRPCAFLSNLACRKSSHVQLHFNS